MDRFVESQKLTADEWVSFVPTPTDDGSDEDSFGAPVALHKNWAAVALGRGVDWSSGDVFLFQKKEHPHTWTPHAMVKAWDSDSYDRFGDSLALSQDTLVVGAPYDDFYSNDHRKGDPGAAYVFEYNQKQNQWTQRFKLQPPDITKSSYYWFGSSVVIRKDVIMVGAIQNNKHWNEPGNVYIYAKRDDEWSFLVKLTASDGIAGNHFGNDLALTDDFVAVGACPADEHLGNGAVYIYKNRQHWSHETKLAAPTASSMFGYSIAAAGTTLVVGAPGTNEKRGAVFVYERDNGAWALKIKLVADQAMDKDYFGLAVELAEDESTILVGAGVAYTSQAGRNYVYQFERKDSEWSQTDRIETSDSLPYTEIGRSLALGGDTLLVGAPGGARYEDRSQDIVRGAVYVFEKNGTPRAAYRNSKTVPLTTSGEVSPWVNILISVLLIFIVQKVFLSNRPNH